MRRKTERELSKTTIITLVGVAIVALVTLYRELPPLRRYLRIARM